MSKKKGLSLEEKRTRLLDLFFETKDFYQLKELEKIAPKQKGITSMSVKDVLQSLVDDAMVDTERIGTSNYFWAYPSKALHARKRKIENLKSEVDELKKKVKRNEANLETANKGKEESSEREKLLASLEQKEKETQELKQKLERLRECDPEVLEEVKEKTLIAKESANRWTDNIFSVKTWCKRKFAIEEAAINKNFGIPEELDYVE
ncbi:meiotic nuclear division protein 1 homolog isoform X2 [Rhopilema esculentum]|uniref:meiotic nuclear division protein 1 homolog isoform X2 n=1 Tax=Rhopilema esculentum TaxID=499914 RepID=UPI0031CFE07F|eukprot:gene15187-6382_t